MVLFNESRKAFRISKKDYLAIFQKNQKKYKKGEMPKKSYHKKVSKTIPTNAVDAFHNNPHDIAVVYAKKGFQGKEMLILC